jgi:hypothetical protein
MEPLERRQLMSAVLGADGTLSVNGSGSGDVLEVRLNNGLSPVNWQVYENGIKTAEFGISSVASISINGNGGNDAITVGSLAKGMSTPCSVSGGAGNDFITVNNAPSTVHGDIGNDSVNGGAANDVIYGDDGNDVLLGNIGNDSINGGWGSDTVDGGAGADSMYGGNGIDVVDYSSRTANLIIVPGAADDDGEAGEHDIVSADIENVMGGAGNDFIGEIFSGSANNCFWGNSGNDTVDGAGGNDSLDGGAGNDSILGWTGNDMCNGGAGNDIVKGEAGDDRLSGGNGDDQVFGAAGNDVLYANGGADSVFGEDGDDRLYGGGWADQLYGGNGNDILVSIGGSQNESVWGQGGFDSFWADSESTELLMDVDAAESPLNVHRVAAFYDCHIEGTDLGSPPRDLVGGDMPDPIADRPYADFSNRPLFSASGPTQDDVRQGQVGDCYFVAPLSALAKTKPNLIRQSIVDLGDGTYAVQFYRGSTKHFIRLDNDLPIRSDTMLPYYASLGAEGSMWVAVMEKAFAFFREDEGTYSSISGGWPDDAYSLFHLGDEWTYPGMGPSALYNNPQWFFSRVKTLLDEGRPVTLCTASGGGYLEELHCYMVDHLVCDSDGDIMQVVLRNPWGTDGASGDSTDDGYVTLTANQAFFACYAVVSAH